MRIKQIKYMEITASTKGRKNGERDFKFIYNDYFYILKNKFDKMLIISNYGL